MGRLAVIDGVRFAAEQAKISVYDRGFLYGDSVFETVRTYGGELFALDEHLERLVSSAEKMAIDLPVTAAQLADEACAAVRDAGNPESFARIVITRGTGPIGLDTVGVEGPARVILVEPLRMPPAVHYQEGLSATCVQTIRASDAVHSAKLSNYLASVMALREARERGSDEVLVVNRDGYVVEGATSNIFVVMDDGTVLTPALGAGVLAGVTRRLVIEVAEQAGVVVDERALTPSELRSEAVREVFLTSSIREIMPIVRVDDATIGEGVPGALTRRLHLGFRARVGLAGAPPPWQAQ